MRTERCGSAIARFSIHFIKGCDVRSSGRPDPGPVVIFMSLAFIEEVEAQLAATKPERRVELLRRITDLLIGYGPRVSNPGLDVFDGVIGILAKDIEDAARLQLSGKLSNIRQAPRGILHKLAMDTVYAVARPVLENSPVLDDDILLKVAATRDEARLTSLAKRATVSERVTDVIVRLGGTVSLRTVADNSGARFSTEGYTTLVQRAANDRVLENILLLRPDLPADFLVKITNAAAEKALLTMRAEFSSDSEEDLRRLVTEAAGAAAEKLSKTHDHAEAEKKKDTALVAASVSELADTGKLTENTIGEWIREGKVPHALSGLAHMAKLSLETIMKAFTAKANDLLLFIAKSVPLSFKTYSLLLGAKAGQPINDEVMQMEKRNFDALSIQTAQRVTQYMGKKQPPIAPRQMVTRASMV
jgi:uncharacterized protein (DUF2336 family)